MPTISLCMIVYNEENNIRCCLESASKFVDEVIIVDTGSTDQTKSICKSFGAQIFDYMWADDFAEARNYSISKASCDWILLLDADEELVVHDFPALECYLQNNSYDLILSRMTHFYGSETSDEERSYFSRAIRIVRNGKDIKFTGRIHERIDIEARKVDEETDTKRFIQILHYGYKEYSPKSKRERNLALLLKEKERCPKDPWLDYHLAAEYYQSEKFMDAYRMVNTAIARFLKTGVLPPALAYKLKYDMLITSGNFETAYNGIEKAVVLYPDYVDLHFYKGILQYVHEEYQKAKETFSHCLILGETNMQYLILSGTGSFFALYYLGLCHKELLQIDQAAEVFEQVTALYPGFDPMKHNLLNIK